MTAPGTDGTKDTGRPTGYDPSIVPQVREWAENGSTDREIWENLGIGRTTFYRWQGAHKEFRKALRVGKLAANRRVERSLYSMAVGHRRKAVKIMQFEGTPVVHEYVEELAPDVGAAKLWLSNRDPKRWRADDGQVTVNTTISLDAEGSLALARRVAFAMAKAKAVDIDAEPAPLLTKGALGKETDK